MSIEVVGVRELIAVVVIASFLMLSLPFPLELRASSWVYRLPIYIVDDINVTDTAVAIELDVSAITSHIRYPDGSDIYFTDAEGNPLYYWVEEYNQSAGYLKVWVRMNLTTYPQLIYMYYGEEDNPYSSYNNPRKVFTVFEDWESGTDLWNIKSFTLTDKDYYSPTHSLYYKTSSTGDDVWLAYADTNITVSDGEYIVWLVLRSGATTSYAYYKVVVNGSTVLSICQSDTTTEWEVKVSSKFSLGSGNVTFRVGVYSTDSASFSTAKEFYIDDVRMFKWYPTPSISVRPEEVNAEGSFLDFILSKPAIIRLNGTALSYEFNDTISAPLILQGFKGYSMRVYKEYVPLGSGTIDSDTFPLTIQLGTRVIVSVLVAQKVVTISYYPVAQVSTIGVNISVTTPKVNVSGLNITYLPPTIMQLSKIELFRFAAPMLALLPLLIADRRWGGIAAGISVALMYLVNLIYGEEVFSNVGVGVVAFIAVLALITRH